MIRDFFHVRFRPSAEKFRTVLKILLKYKIYFKTAPFSKE